MKITIKNRIIVACVTVAVGMIVSCGEKIKDEGLVALGSDVDKVSAETEQYVRERRWIEESIHVVTVDEHEYVFWHHGSDFEHHAGCKKCAGGTNE